MNQADEERKLKEESEKTPLEPVNDSTNDNQGEGNAPSPDLSAPPTEPTSPSEADVQSFSPKINLDISPDKLTASITILPEKGCTPDQIKLNEEDIHKVIQMHKIQYGILKENISAAVNERKFQTKIQIAQGVESKNGSNAKIEYYFNFDHETYLDEDQDGRVNFKESHQFDTVRDGDILVRRIPHTKGNDGINIFGKKIPHVDGKDVVLRLGKNVEFMDEQKFIRATQSGVPIKKGSKISVLETLRLNTVDYDTGNLHFVGTVEIQKEVQPGFLIEAGTLILHGAADNADFVSENDIIMKHGLTGDGTHSIKAKNNIQIPFIQNYEIECGNTITVRDYLLHCTGWVEKNLILTNERSGYILGGKIICGDTVEAYSIGSKMTGVKTEITVGISPELEMELNNVKIDIVQSKENLDKLEKSELFLKSMHFKLGSKFPESKKKLLHKITIAIDSLRIHMDEIRNRKTEVESMFSDGIGGKLIVKKVIYPNVIIRIGRHKKIIDQSYGPGTFMLVEEGGIGYIPGH